MVAPASLSSQVSLAWPTAAVLSAPWELAQFGLRRRVPVASQWCSPLLPPRPLITGRPETRLSTVSFWAVFQKHSEFPFRPSQAAGSARLTTPQGCWLSGQRAWLPPSSSWPFLREPQGTHCPKEECACPKGGGPLEVVGTGLWPLVKKGPLVISDKCLSQPSPLRGRPSHHPHLVDEEVEAQRG